MVERDVRRVMAGSDEQAELLELYPRALDERRCRDMPSHMWICTRPHGHVGVHVGHIGSTLIGAYWVREEPTSH